MDLWTTSTRLAIEREGVEVFVVDGNYDVTIAQVKYPLA